MSGHHVAVGVLFLAATLGFIGWRYFRLPRRRVPLWGWIGLAIILAAEFMLALRAQDWVAIYFTPIVWTGYILLVDGLVRSLNGESRLTRSPVQFLALAFWSVPLWLLFEAYNLRLANWIYVGMPQGQALNDFGYAWAFATIWPGVFETADLLGAVGLFQKASRPGARSTPRQRSMISLAGLVLVAAPVLVPVRIGSYLFGAVWVGFVLLLDPILYQWRGPSLLRDFEAGHNTRLFCFLASGWVCGILWEFWNYWAGARWIYVFPVAQHWKIFEMPAPGFTGFPPFAVECFVMYEFLLALKRRLAAAGERPELAGTEA